MIGNRLMSHAGFWPAPHFTMSGDSMLWSMSSLNCLAKLAASNASRVMMPTSMLRSKAASVMLAEVMNAASSSTTIALACRTPRTSPGS